MPEASAKLRWIRSRGFARRGWVLLIALVACVGSGVALFGTGGHRPLSGSGPHPETARYTDVAAGVSLIDRFKSYDDVQKVSELLVASNYKDWAQYRRYSESSSSYPPYNFDTLEVGAYRHLDSPGRLTLLFFNDRLFQIEFVPADPQAYARKLHGLGMERDRNARFEKLSGDLRIVSNVELAITGMGAQLHMEPLVLWQDRRLIRERDEWDDRFGSIPRHLAAR